MQPDHPMYFLWSYLVTANVPVPGTFSNWEEFLTNLYNLIIGEYIEIVEGFGLD